MQPLSTAVLLYLKGPTMRLMMDLVLAWCRKHGGSLTVHMEGKDTVVCLALPSPINTTYKGRHVLPHMAALNAYRLAEKRVCVADRN